MTILLSNLGPHNQETGSQRRPFDGFCICVIAVIISTWICYNTFCISYGIPFKYNKQGSL